MNTNLHNRYIKFLKAYIECLKYFIKSRLEIKGKWCIEFNHDTKTFDVIIDKGLPNLFFFNFDSKEEGEVFVKDNIEHLKTIME